MIDKEKATKYKDDVKKSKSKSDYNPMDKFEVVLLTNSETTIFKIEIWKQHIESKCIDSRVFSVILSSISFIRTRSKI